MGVTHELDLLMNESPEM
jgi:hypothetical protein